MVAKVNTVMEKMRREPPTIRELLISGALRDVYNAIGEQIMGDIAQQVDVNKVMQQISHLLNRNFPRFGAAMPSALPPTANVNFVSAVANAARTFINAALSPDRLDRLVDGIVGALQLALPPLWQNINPQNIIASAVQRAQAASRGGSVSAQIARRLLDFLGPPRRGRLAQEYQMRNVARANLADAEWWESVVLPPLQNLMQTIGTMRTRLHTQFIDELRDAIRDTITQARDAALRSIEDWEQRLSGFGLTYSDVVREMEGLNTELANIRSDALRQLQGVVQQLIARYIEPYNNTVQAQINNFWQQVRSKLTEQPGSEAGAEEAQRGFSQTVVDELNNAIGRLRAGNIPNLVAYLQSEVIPRLVNLVGELSTLLDTRRAASAQALISELNFLRTARAPIFTDLLDVINRLFPLFNIVNAPNATAVQTLLRTLANEISRLGGAAAAPTGGGVPPIGRPPTGRPPAGGATFAKAQIKDPWRELRRMQPKFKPPKQITQILLWLPRLTEQERAKLTQFLYRYWLAVDKDERKEALRDLVRVAKEMGIPIKG